MQKLIYYLYTIPVPFRRTLIRFIVVPLTTLFNQQSYTRQLTESA